MKGYLLVILTITICTTIGFFLGGCAHSGYTRYQYGTYYGGR